VWSSLVAPVPLLGLSLVFHRALAERDVFGLIESEPRPQDRSRRSASAPPTVGGMSQRYGGRQCLRRFPSRRFDGDRSRRFLLISLAVMGSPGPSKIGLVAVGSA
jgi:hypothetical protein